MANKADGISVANPAGSSDRRQGDDYIRALARAVVELINKDHYVGSAATDLNGVSGYAEEAAGEHAKVTLQEASDPAQEANKGKLYTKNDGTRTELYWIGETGGSATPKKLTANGTLNIVDADIAGITTFATFPVTPSSAPTTDYQVANKKYVDEIVPAYSGAQSVAIGGLIIKMGEVSASVSGTAVSFSAAFPGGVVAAFACPNNAGNLTQSSDVYGKASVDSLTVNGMNVSCGGNAYWIAIGY
jgi:hypothetical protein